MHRRVLKRLRVRLRAVGEYVGVTVGSVVLLAIGFWQGIQLERLTFALWLFSLRVSYLEAAATFLLFTAVITIAGGLLLREVTRSRNRERYRYDGPPAEALIPVYRDGAVLSRSVESLLESEYEQLRIRIVCEPGDDETIAVAESFTATHQSVEVAINGQPGSKADAINDAVARSSAEYFLVFDADEVVKRSFVPAAIGALCNGADVFQGRRVPEPTGRVETLAYCERALFHASYKLVELTGFANCRSSSTAFTRDAWRTVDGYVDCPTEDLAFAHACYRHGLDVDQRRNHVNRMEAPHTLGDLWGQRKRWRTGQIEVFHRMLLGRGDGSRLRRVISLGRISSSVLESLFTLTLASKFFVLFLVDAETLYLTPIVVICLIVGGLLWRDLADDAVDDADPVWAATPFLLPFFGVLTIASVFGYLFTWNGEWFRVEKGTTN